jgi:hypothetical protein
MGKKYTRFLVGTPKRREPIGRRIKLIWTYKQQEARGVERTHLTKDKDNH